MTDNEEKKAESTETIAGNSSENAEEKVGSEPLLADEKKEQNGSKQDDKEAGKQSPPLLKDSLPSQAKVKKQGRGVAWLAFLLALCGLGGAGYTYWQMEQYQQADRAAVKSAESRLLASAQQQAESLNSDLRSYQQRMAEQERAIEEVIVRIANTRRQIGEITQVSRRSWMLAEAEYLLRLANQRLVMEQENTSVLALLKATDEILVKVDDIHLHEVRRQIASEIASLRALGKMDIQGTFLTLAALAEQLSQLPLLSPQQEQAAEAILENSYSLDSVLERLSDLVVIRQRDQPVAPLLPPEQHYYVQQNLRLMLEQAQLALLQRKPTLYLQSLKKAEQWITDYFQLNSSTTAMLEGIAELKTVDVAPALPDISGSLTLLKAYLTNPEQPLSKIPGSTATNDPVAAAGAGVSQ